MYFLGRKEIRQVIEKSYDNTSPWPEVYLTEDILEATEQAFISRDQKRVTHTPGNFGCDVKPTHTTRTKYGSSGSVTTSGTISKKLITPISGVHESLSESWLEIGDIQSKMENLEHRHAHHTVALERHFDGIWKELDALKFLVRTLQFRVGDMENKLLLRNSCVQLRRLAMISMGKPLRPFVSEGLNDFGRVLQRSVTSFHMD